MRIRIKKWQTFHSLINIILFLDWSSPIWKLFFSGPIIFQMAELMKKRIKIYHELHHDYGRNSMYVVIENFVFFVNLWIDDRYYFNPWLASSFDQFLTDLESIYGIRFCELLGDLLVERILSHKYSSGAKRP